MTKMFGKTLIGLGLMTAVGAAIFYVEQHHEIAHFRLVSFGLTFLCFCIAIAVVPRRLRSPALLMASLAFGLTLIEAAAALIEPKTDLAGVFETGVRVPVLGWDNGPAGAYPASRTNLQTGAPIYDVTYTIGAHHERATKSDSSGRSVVFLGDSFTFGTGVGDSDTMSQRFADLLNRRQKVLNLGVAGFSPSQVLAELQTGLKDDVIGKAPVAFVMLTGAFHVARTACKESWTIRAPRYEQKDGRLVFVGACADGATEAVRRFVEQSAAYRVFVKPFRVRINHRDIDTYIDIVAEIARTAKTKYGVETIVPYIGGPVIKPKSLQLAQAKVLPIWAYLPGTGYDDDKIIAELQARGVKVVDMTLREEAMSGHRIGIAEDGHPTPFAHARRAEMTLAALKSLGVPLAGPGRDAPLPVSVAEQP